MPGLSAPPATRLNAFTMPLLASTGGGVAFCATPPVSSAVAGWREPEVAFSVMLICAVTEPGCQVAE